MLWQDLQESFFLVFAPCLLGVILPFFVAGGVVIAAYTFIKRALPWRRRK